MTAPVRECQPEGECANFEEWKVAREAYYKADGKYCDTREILLELGNKRSRAWEALVQAAYKLSDSEKELAVEFEYGPGPALPSGDRK